MDTRLEYKMRQLNQMAEGFSMIEGLLQQREQAIRPPKGKSPAQINREEVLKNPVKTPVKHKKLTSIYEPPVKETYMEHENVYAEGGSLNRPSFENAADNIDKQNDFGLMANFSAKGGILNNRNIFAKGGNMVKAGDSLSKVAQTNNIKK